MMAKEKQHKCPKCKKGFTPRQHKHFVASFTGFKPGVYHAKCCPLH